MKKLKTRLDAFSDAVIAIILTIMVLDLTPVLKDNINDYVMLGKEIGVYIISFAFVANNWYQHATLFNEIDDMTYRIMLNDFLYLIPLSLTPLATNMMASNTTSITVVAYGILVAVVNFCFRILAKSVIHFQYTDRSQMRRIYTKIYGNHNIYFSLISIALIVLGYFFPQIVLWFFLPYPLVYMIFSSKDRQQMYDAAQLTTDQQEQYLKIPASQLKKFQKIAEETTDESPQATNSAQSASNVTHEYGHINWLDRPVNPAAAKNHFGGMSANEIKELRRQQWEQFIDHAQKVPKHHHSEDNHQGHN